MDKEIKKLLEEDINQKEKIKYLQETDGWEIVEKAYQEKVEEMRDITTCKTFEEMIGRQIAIKILDNWWNELIGIRNKGEMAEQELESKDDY